jgi:nucleotidyltransferase/DNA polymerase involved in DNA repair
MADGYLTNRKPTPAELDKGQHLLEAFIDLFPVAKRVAIGRVSEALLAERGISTVGQVRHPANGGATLFRDGIQEILLKEPK